MQKLMAFWKYGHFPYLLCGEVMSFREDGTVKVREYGGGIFRPVKILPYDAGKEVDKKLRSLAGEHSRAEDALNIEFLKKVREIANF